MYVERADPFEVQEAEHFPRIAAQLRANIPAPQVRDQLMRDFDLCKLAAGKLVEDVQKGMRRARINVVSGGGVWLLGATLLLLFGGGLLAWGLLLAGVIQLSAGYRTMWAYRRAVYEDT